jgi:hypothetical protein
MNWAAFGSFSQIYLTLFYSRANSSPGGLGDKM